jgi:ADP-ribose pyrophosphatase YjhB (NUDIX family)
MILATPDWPTLEQAIRSILEEETGLTSKESSTRLHGDNHDALTQARTSTIHISHKINASRLGYKKRREWCVIIAIIRSCEEKMFRVDRLSSWLAAKIG